MIDINSIKNGKLLNGNSATALKRIPSESIDVVVTDPPYGLEYDKYKWDKDLPEVGIWVETLRVLKPGGFAFIMCSPRQDLLSLQVMIFKRAGFQINFTSLYWVYKTGMSNARKILKGQMDTDSSKGLEGAYAGFQPRPATEVILVAMKPLTEKSYTAQAHLNGKGITFLDGCAIPFVDKKGQLDAKKMSNIIVSNQALDPFFGECGAIECLDAKGESYRFSLDGWAKQTLPYLLTAKAPKKEKEFGLDNLPENKLEIRRPGLKSHNVPMNPRPTARKNIHPMVKPLKLMSYLIVLGSRQGELVLDPFCGSGTTCLAARLLGRKFIGIELEKKYYEIAYERLQNVSGGIQKPTPSASGKVQRLSDFESFELQSQGGAIIDVSGGKGLVEAINFALNNPSTTPVEVQGFKITGVKKQNLEQQKEPDNVQDWADKGINISRGCSNDCRYCYAREESVRRHGNTVENWPKEKLNPKIINKGWRLSSKRLMFPSTHDITPGTYDACETVLKKLLKAGNKVLVVSKPRPELIEKLCNAIDAYKNQVMFRFTITAMDNNVLEFWEPNAPSYEDRKKALALVKEKGFRTSVSIEPMLDSPNVGDLIEDLRPHTTECMWVGPMKMVRKRVVNDSSQVEREIVKIISDQTPVKLLPIYMSYKDDPMIKWKGHYRKQLRKLRVDIPPQKDDWHDRIPR